MRRTILAVAVVGGLVGGLLGTLLGAPSGVALAGAAITCAPSPSIAVAAKGNAFEKQCYAAPVTPFKIVFRNDDPFSHNFSIYTKKGGDPLFQGKYVKKSSTVTYDVPAQLKGSYYFQCDIHPFMNGAFLVGAGGSAPAAVRDEGRAPKGPEISLVKVADGLTAPVFSTGAGDGTHRLFIVDQTGTIRIVGKDGKLRDRPFLNISSKLVKQKSAYDERGLLGLAFHPQYKTNGRFYVWYSAPLRAGAPKGWDSTIHLAEYRVTKTDPDVADATSEVVIMAIDHPQANHNSGHIAFGPDGFLYIPIGDGGNANDVGLGHPPLGNAQDRTTILGNILRIDVDIDKTLPSGAVKLNPYGIPKDNPYAHHSGKERPEIYANGFRNPYHISFDAGGDHALYAADAGQDRFEEVSKVVKGGNYGWHIKEGSHCFSVATPSTPPKTCPSTGPGGDRLIDPVIEYNHTEILGSVIIGGYIYRGADVPALKGKYVFGDYSRDRIKPDGTLFVAMPRTTSGTGGLWPIKELRVTIADDPDSGPGFGRFVIAFGQDDDHELYVSLTGRGGPAGQSGAVYRITSAENGNAAAEPLPYTSSGSGGTVILLVVLGLLLLLGIAIIGKSQGRNH